MISKRYALAAVMLAVGTPCYAQAPAEQAALRQLTLSPNTEVVVAPNDTLVTKSVKVGDKFRISTVFDVMQDGYVLIPRGTPGEATVTYRTGKGSFGKSGKMEVAFNYLDLGGRHIPLSGTYRQEGQGNTGAAVGAVVAVGVFGAFVTGHSATLVSGQQLRAHTMESLAFNVPAGAVAIQTASLAPPAPVAIPTAPVAVTASAAPASPAGPIPAAVPATGVTTEGGTITKPTAAAS